jgi:hypothetical protein
MPPDRVREGMVMFLRTHGNKSMKHLLPALLVLSVVACASTGGTPPAQTSAPGDAAASAPPPSSSSSPNAANTPASDAKTDSSPAVPAAAAPQVAGPGTSALGGLPLLITLPDGAVLKPTEFADQSQVKLASGKGTLTVGAWNPDNDEAATLDAFQKFVTHTKMTLLAKSGSGTSYSVTYKASFSPLITFIRRMKVGDTEVECMVNGVRDKGDVAAYDAICKSLRAKTP